MTKIQARFEISEWTESVDDGSAEGPKLTSVAFRKNYDGEIVGTGVGRVLTAQGDAGGGYVASEQIVGSLGERTGGFVIQHGGLADGTGQSTFGQIVPGSGSGDLGGITGSASEDEQGVLTLDYRLG